MSNSYGNTYYSEAYNDKEHQQNLEYKKKHKKLKKLIKNIVIVCIEYRENILVVQTKNASPQILIPRRMQHSAIK